MVENIDSIFDEIGGFGWAQIIILLMIFFVHFGGSWSMIQIAYIGKTPRWFCAKTASNLLSNTSELHLSSSNESAYEKMCVVNGSTCTDFRYDNDAYSIVAEWDLVCAYKWIPKIIISIQMFGVLVGAVYAGTVGERYGRRKCLFWANVFHAVVTFVEGFSTTWQMFAVCRFCVGAGIGGIFTTTFTYSMEFIPIKNRGRVAIFPFWTIGVAIFVGVAYWLRDWRNLHFSLAAFCVPSFATYFIVPESIRWLAVQGHLDEAMSAVERMARWNRHPVPKNTRSILENVYFKRKYSVQEDKVYGYLDLFRTRSLLKITLVLCYFWCCMSVISYGITFGAAGLSGSVYLAILLTNSVEIPGLVPGLFMMDKLGRKWTVVIMFSAICITTIGSFIINVKGWDQNYWVILSFALMMKLCTDNVWNVIQAWTTELYPTVTRSLGYGMSATSARLGGMLAPFVIDLESRLVLTYVLITTMALLVILLALTLPETGFTGLQDNLVSDSSLSSSERDVNCDLELEIDFPIGDEQTRKAGHGEEGANESLLVEEETSSVSIVEEQEVDKMPRENSDIEKLREETKA